MIKGVLNDLLHIRAVKKLALNLRLLKMTPLMGDHYLVFRNAKRLIFKMELKVLLNLKLISR